MNRILTIALLAGFPALLVAQNVPQSSITIGAPTVPWFKFYVDGQLYQGTATFVWPQGSKHTVQALSNVPGGVTCPGSLATQLNTGGAMAVLFAGWRDNKGLLVPAVDPVQTIPADPSILALTATIQLSYRVTLNYYTGPLAADGTALYCLATIGSPGPPPPDLPPGTAYIDGIPYWNSAI